MRRRTTSMG